MNKIPNWIPSTATSKLASSKIILAAANIILDDANLDVAVEGIQLGILFNQGEVCSAGSRLLVQEGIYDELMKRLKDVFSHLKVGC